MIFCGLFRALFSGCPGAGMNKPGTGFPPCGFLSNYITYETQNSP